MRRMALLHAVVCGADQVDLAELGEDLQHQIVPVGLLDLLAAATQQLFGRDLVGGEGQPTRAVEIARDAHGAILGSDGRARHARRSAGADYLQLTVTVNGLVIMPAIGFFMSAPAASPVMV